MGAKVIGSFGDDPIPASDIAAINAKKPEARGCVLMGEVIVIGSRWPIQIGESLLQIFVGELQSSRSLKTA